MGSAPSHHHDDDDDYDDYDHGHDHDYDHEHDHDFVHHGVRNKSFQSTRSVRSAQTYRSSKKPSDTRSTILRVEKTQRDFKVKEEREHNQQNGFTPFTPRGTIGYDAKPKPGSYAPPHGTSLANKRKGGGKKGGKGRPTAASVSFQPGNVYFSDEEDVLDLNDEEDDGLTGKDKIESYLRKSRVPETKVRQLAVKLWEQCHKEYDDQLQKLTADTTALKTVLQNIINQPLDLLLYGKANRTSLKGAGGPGLSLEELVKKVADMVELLETDIALCFDSCERHINTKVGAKSVPLAVKDAFIALQTDYDILYEKYHELRREKDDAVFEQAKTQHRSVALEESSLHVEKEFRKLVGQNRELYEHLKELKVYKRQHKNSTQHMAEDITRLKKQVQWYQESNAIVSKDLLKLQETCTQLQVQNAEQAKEIRRLKDPDKEMIYKIQRLQTELTEAKTANRKLELERGTVKTSLVKLQAQFDSVQKDRSTLTKQKQKLQKENEKVKTTNKKLKLSS